MQRPADDFELPRRTHPQHCLFQVPYLSDQTFLIPSLSVGKASCFSSYGKCHCTCARSFWSDVETYLPTVDAIYEGVFQFLSQPWVLLIFWGWDTNHSFDSCEFCCEKS